MAPIVPIALLLGKADTAFKLVGGSSIVFNVIRSRLFGKILRTVEYPDGELRTVKIHRMNRYRLQTLIAEAQPPPFPTAYLNPEDIQQISLFTSPHFTEPILSDADVSLIPENAWLFWSKESIEEDPIPLKSVKLDGSHIKKKTDSKPEPTVSDIMLQDRAIGIARRLFRHGRKLVERDAGDRHAGFSTAAWLEQWEHDRIVDLAVDRDCGLLAIARNFGDSDEEFSRHCRRLLQRRDPHSILLADGAAADAGDGGAVGEAGDDTSARKVAEPQVELASRE